MFQAENIAVMIPVVALMIPIVALLTKHQQRMAELIHKGQGDQQMNSALLHELQSLRSEIAQIKETVNQQAIAIDDVRAASTSDLAQRVNNNG